MEGFEFIRRSSAVMRTPKLHIVLLLIIASSCATTPKSKRKTITNETVITSDRVQQHLIDETLPVCDYCLIGSIGDEELKKADKKVYFLHGAEELGLNNYYFDFPVVYNEATKKWVKYFTGRGRELYKRYAARSGRYAPVLSKILNDQGMPRDLIYLAMAESGFQNHARSWAKAVGPWQFMPFTGRKFGLEVGFFKDERRDPLKATVAASMYLRDLYELFGSWELAAAAYNAGEGKIGRAIRRYHTKNFWELRNGRYLKAETKNYVPKIMALAIIGKNLKAFGFTGDDAIVFDHPLDFEEIEVPGNTDLYKTAEALDLTFDEIKRYNPELVRWQTPPKEATYALRVPVGKKATWDSYAHKETIKANEYKIYTVKGYSSLVHVGRKYNVPVNVLAELNGLDPNKNLMPNSIVYLPFRADHENRGHQMYADLYEKPRASVLRRSAYKNLIASSSASGKHIKNPKEFYIVKKGDSLWTIARKMGVNINTLIKSNMGIVKKRMILPGDRLAIR